jgi:hypothetical protein
MESNGYLCVFLAFPNVNRRFESTEAWTTLIFPPVDSLDWRQACAVFRLWYFKINHWYKLFRFSLLDKKLVRAERKAASLRNCALSSCDRRVILGGRWHWRLNRPLICTHRLCAMGGYVNPPFASLQCGVQPVFLCAQPWTGKYFTHKQENHCWLYIASDVGYRCDILQILLVTNCSCFNICN